MPEVIKEIFTYTVLSTPKCLQTKALGGNNHSAVQNEISSSMMFRFSFIVYQIWENIQPSCGYIVVTIYSASTSYLEISVFRGLWFLIFKHLNIFTHFFQFIFRAIVSLSSLDTRILAYAVYRTYLVTSFCFPRIKSRKENKNQYPFKVDQSFIHFPKLDV